MAEQKCIAEHCALSLRLGVRACRLECRSEITPIRRRAYRQNVIIGLATLISLPIAGELIRMHMIS